MKYRYWVLLIILLLGACRPVVQSGTSTPEVSATSTLPGPQVNTTHAPEVTGVATDFLEAWKAEDYSGMYALLAQSVRDSMSEDDFAARYNDIAINMNLQELEFEILSSLTNPKSAQVSYKVVYHTSLVGDLQRDMVMNLSLEGDDWTILWEDGMILPELSGGNRLAVDIKVPARANIYDRDSEALAAQADSFALGVIPAEIDEDQEGRLLAELSRLTGIQLEWIEAMYDDDRGANWYIPIGETLAQNYQDRFDILSGLTGLRATPYSARYYYEEGIAAHVTGYVQPIFQEEAEEYQRRGFRADERVGKMGLEFWGQDYLTGKRGASLYVVNPDGEIVTRLAQTESEPSQAIYMTIDADLQRGVEKSIAGFRGAVVVMERDTGRVLAMASSPDFNPNLLEYNNFNSGYRDQLLSSEQPYLNRASQGLYPLGSVFKIITMAAALESGIYTAESTYECGTTFTELIGQIYYDWTYEKELPASGTLTLPEGLMRSCNPWFYHIGLDLYRQNLPEAVSEMARAFGLGSLTGIEQVGENAGNMPNPVSEDDAVQLSIGQGAMLVTPLQVVRFIAAIGNGGNLLRPQVVEQIVGPDGNPTYQFESEITGTLPVSEENMQIIQDAMNSVVSNRRGTAFTTFTGLNVPIYGKTGTAQNPFGDAHAWFAGYTDSARTDRSNIAVVVVAENAGEGSEVAAPIFRRVIELYYDGKPNKLYPWESSYYITATPPGEETETPEATDTPAE
jgi:penicillin-binding protein 2